MKTRHGFISNSSSSSFIIVYKQCRCPTCGRSIFKDLENRLLSNIDYNDYAFISGKDEIIKFIKHDWGVSEDDKIIKQIRDVKMDYMKDDIVYLKTSNNNLQLFEEITASEILGLAKILYKSEC